MKGVSDEKNRVEEGQREMRKTEEREGKEWNRVFFKNVGRDEAGEELVRRAGQNWESKQTVGVWKFDSTAWEERRRPFHGGLRPDNTVEEDSALDDAAEGQQRSVHNAVTMSNGDMAAGKTKQSPSAPVRAGEQPSQGQTVARGSLDSAAPSEKAHPPLPPEQQQKEAQEMKLADGVGGMSMEEQTAVEEMLRDEYTSAAGRKRNMR